jgi:hypothetical protein
MKKTMGRIIGIGIFHIFLYVYLVPFVIYPRFGSSGLKFTIAVAIVISIAALGTLFLEKRK